MSCLKTALFILAFIPGIALAQDSYDTTIISDENSYTEEGVQEYDVQAVEPSTLPATREYTEKEIDVQKFNKSEWEKIVGSTDYTEQKKKIEPKEEKEEKKSSVSTPDVTTPWSGDGLKVVFYVLVIAIVLLILWAVLKNMSFDVRLRKTTVIEDAVTNIENIEEIDIDGYLKKARAEKNYRLAIRLYYLGLLKRLNENNLIAWKKDKTNLDYLSELFNRDFHYDEIRRLTLAYEEVWYGERNANEEVFQRVIAGFETMFGKINSTSAS